MSINVSILQQLKERRTRLTALLDRVKLPEPNSIVELAAGIGTLSIVLRERFPHATVTAIDRDIAFLRSYLDEEKIDGISLIEADITTECLSEQYDLICYCNVVRHLRRAGMIRSLRESAAHLSPEGRCILIERDDSAGNEPQALMRRIHDLERDIDRKLGEPVEEPCTPAYLETLVVESGLVVERLTCHSEASHAINGLDWARWRDDLVKSVAPIPEPDRTALQKRIVEIDNHYQDVGLETLPICVVLCRV